MASPEKITVHNLADLKNTSDDAIPNYLNSLKFRQSHTLIDVRLALGYTAFAIAAACFAWDYKLGFPATKHYTAAAVLLYMVLNGVLTLWIWLVEKGTVYVGTAPSGETVRIVTATKKNVPRYNMMVHVQPKGRSAKPQSISISRPFAEWFDGVGHFIAPSFQGILATEIPCVGKLDAKRVARLSSSSPYTADMLNALSSADASGTATQTADRAKNRRRA